MGLLKHAILPFLAAVHWFSLRAQLSVDTWADMLNISADDDSIKDSPLLLHSMGILRAYNFAMMALCMYGVVVESSHFRGVLIVAESIIFGIVTIDAYLLELDWIIPASMASGSIIGAVVHAKEPGIFTVDKNKTQKKKSN